MKKEIEVLVRVDPENWNGTYQSLKATDLDTIPKTAKITDQNADSECEFKLNSIVFLTENKLGLIATWPVTNGKTN